jgi:hypothetical protein
MQPGIAGISSTDVRLDLNQIVRQAEEHARLESLSTRELSDLAHSHEMEAAKARYYLWQRRALQHQSN